MPVLVAGERYLERHLDRPGQPRLVRAIRNESDPDILKLRRQDDSFVAAFSARGATTEGLIEAAKDDYWELVRVYWASQKATA